MCDFPEFRIVVVLGTVTSKHPFMPAISVCPCCHARRMLVQEGFVQEGFLHSISEDDDSKKKKKTKKKQTTTTMMEK